MPDTQTHDVGGSPDAYAGRYRLTRDVVDAVKRRHKLRSDADVWQLLGMSRSTFYRLLAGRRPISLDEAAVVAGLVKRPVLKVFETADTKAAA